MILDRYGWSPTNIRPCSDDSVQIISISLKRSIILSMDLVLHILDLRKNVQNEQVVIMFQEFFRSPAMMKFVEILQDIFENPIVMIMR